MAQPGMQLVGIVERIVVLNLSFLRNLKALNERVLSRVGYENQDGPASRQSINIEAMKLRTSAGEASTAQEPRSNIIVSCNKGYPLCLFQYAGGESEA